MLKIAHGFNAEYEDLLNRARKKLEGKWVRKTVDGGEVVGVIKNITINADKFRGIKVYVEWTDWPDALEDLRDLQEW